MRKQMLFLLVSAALVLAGCQPKGLVSIGPAASIEPFQDVRDGDLTALKEPLDRAIIESLWFNQSIAWPDEASKKLAEEILEQGKNPGLGVRKLHEQGITGKGVRVAIIDQNLLLDHPEFTDKVTEYFDTGTKTSKNEGSMHGPAVTSLLVGESIGTAPGAQVYYAAAPSWLGDAKYYAQALDWIVEQNQALPEGEKIRVVSVSAAPSGQGSPFGKNNATWDAAYQRATEAGLLILDCTENHGVTGACYLDLTDPENPAKCTPGWPDGHKMEDPNRIYIPAARRTTAEEYSANQPTYQYDGQGGLSWTVPYLAGVLALGWEIRPDLSGEQMLQLIFDTAYVTEDGLKVINPPAFIEKVKRQPAP